MENRIQTITKRNFYFLNKGEITACLYTVETTTEKIKLMMQIKDERVISLFSQKATGSGGHAEDPACTRSINGYRR